MPRGVRDGWRVWAVALVAAAMAVAASLLAAGPVAAEAAVSHYDTAAYVYDAPALLSSPDTVATGTRGSPSGLGAASWVTPVSVARNVVAAETADHIVLGKSIGLSEQAAKIGGRDLMTDPAWQDSVLKAIANPETKISVALDGVEGSSTYGRVASAALRGSQGTGTPFDWEMAQLMQSGRLPTVNFFDGGASVANPFG